MCAMALVFTVAAARNVEGFQVGPSCRKHRSYACQGDPRIFSTAIGGEPAGVTTIFLAKRERLKETVRLVVSLLRPNARSLSLSREMVGEVSEGGMSELDIPEWACQDASEKSRLSKMKYLLKDEFSIISNKVVSLDGVGTVKVLDAFPDVYSDLRLLRFLRKDAVQDPIKAADRFRHFLKWREENSLDAVRAMVENNPFHPPSSLMSVDRFIPCDFGQHDHSKHEAIPMLLHVGDWNTEGITAHIDSGALSMDNFLKYWAFMFESLTKKLHEDGIASKKMLYVDQICDLTTLDLQQFSPSFVSRVLKPWLSLTQNNYPETTKRIIFFRPPRIISLIWALVTPLVSPGTVAKVQMKRGFKGTGEQFMRSECLTV